MRLPKESFLFPVARHTTQNLSHSDKWKIMKLTSTFRYFSILIFLVLGFNWTVQANEEKKQESINPTISLPVHSHETKPEGSEHKKEGSASHSNKALPPCKGSYSKIHWTDCRGLKKAYNGPQFVGQSYEGDFKEGRPHGSGEIKYIDGTRFVGSFEMGVREGKGTEYAKDGSLTLEGFWRTGVLVNIVQGAPQTSHSEKGSTEPKEGSTKNH
jgi:hypothetical protein